MGSTPRTAMVLAAGLGTRMKSKLPKVLHALAALMNRKFPSSAHKAQQRTKFSVAYAVSGILLTVTSQWCWPASGLDSVRHRTDGGPTCG